ncbi:RHS repeat-associated core domain-containing protein [Pseudomonas sp. YJ42]|uniref:RHS repeat-associated core domain-containing protein n=1 Tax=Pseudomonas sp. YJ42 TaxID=3392115 RepID=UPI0039A0D5C9
MNRFLCLLAASLLCLFNGANAETLSFTTYYHNDYLGSPVAATDERNELLWRAHFRPFGERQEDTSTVRFGSVGYTGHAQDEASELIYAGARHYDPILGRFLSVDPAAVQVQSPVTFNRYAYGNNNPHRYIDPDGRMSDDAILHGGWTPGFEVHIYNGPGGVGPINGLKGGLAPQGELVSNPVLKGADVKSGSGRAGKQAKLRDLANDDKLGSADRGWIKQELNSIERGHRNSIRNPPGKDLAHERGREAAKGYNYEHSKLQDRKLHRTQHKYDDFGRKNKERPVQ